MRCSFLQIEVKVDFYFITLYLYTFDRMEEEVGVTKLKRSVFTDKSERRYYKDKLNHFE